MAKKEKEEKVKKEEKQRVTTAIMTQMLTLATSAFGLVAALAWNSLIQNFFANYVANWLPGADIISQLAYALLVTILAVVITFQLSRIKEHVEKK